MTLSAQVWIAIQYIGLYVSLTSEQGQVFPYFSKQRPTKLLKLRLSTITFENDV